VSFLEEDESRLIPRVVTRADSDRGSVAITAGARGLLLLQDYQLLETLAHQNRERIPERTVHAKGRGAYGFFILSYDNHRET